MLNAILSILGEYHIELCGCLPLSRCRVTRQYLLDKAEIYEGSVVIFAIPYYSNVCEKKHNVSAYAVPRDYHLFAHELADTLTARLKTAFPQNKLAVFADHSPIDERDAAVRAGLGVMGKNGLLITEKYSSYVFLGEIVTDAILPYQEYPVRHCISCGACLAACPWQRGESDVCLSALSQKKGVLSDAEHAVLCRYNCIWGCDICQEVCPHTQQARATKTLYTPIPFFQEDCLPLLSSDLINTINEKEFASRAYSWRGRETIVRNLLIAEAAHDPKRRDPIPEEATK